MAVSAALADLVVSIRAQSDSVQKELKKTTRELRKLGMDLQDVGKTLTIGVTAPIAGAAAAILKVGVDFEAAVSKIRTGTGATGEALAGLTADFRAVAATVPENMAQVSSAVADLNTRLGLTGEPLQNMTRQMLDLARVTGENVNGVIQSSTRFFGDWGVAVGDQTATLDLLFRAMQTTGIGLNRLMDLTVQFGAPLRNLGFDMEEAVALFAKWEQEGVNVEAVMSGLRISVAKFAEDGKTGREGLEEIIAAIQSAGTEAEGTALAMEVFGTRAGADLAAAVREGRFEIAELVATLTGGTDTIQAAAEDAKTFGERWAEVRNSVMLALTPLGESLLGVLQKLQEPIKNLAEGLASLVQWFTSLPGGVQATVAGMIALAAAIGPVLYVAGSLVKSFAALLPLLVKVAPALKAVAVSAGPLAAIFAAVAFTVSDTASRFKTFEQDNRSLGDQMRQTPTLWQAVKNAMNPVGAAIEAVGRGVNMAKAAWKAWQEDGIRGVIKASGEFEKSSKSTREELNRHKIATDATEESIRKSQKAMIASIAAAKERGEIIGAVPAVEEDAQEAVEDLTEALDASTAAAKSATEAKDRLIQSFRDAIEPSTALAEKIGALESASFDQKTITIELRGEIERAIAKHKELGTEIDPLVVKYGALIAEMDDAKESLREQTTGVTAAEKAMKDLAADGIAPAITGLGSLSDELTDEMNPAWVAYKAEQDAATAAAEAFGASADGAKAKFDALGGSVKTGGKEMTDAWAKQVSTIVNDFAKGVVDILLKWEGMWQSLKDLTVELGKAVLRSIVESLIEPVIKKITEMFTDLLGKLVKKTQDTIAGALAGGAAEGAGGAAGGAAAGGSGAMSWWAVGILAGASIIGGLLAGRTSKTDKKTEENTRFCAIALIGPMGVIETQHEANRILWRIRDSLYELLGSAEGGLGAILWQIRWHLVDFKELAVGHLGSINESLLAPAGASAASVNVRFDIRAHDSVDTERFVRDRAIPVIRTLIRDRTI